MFNEERHFWVRLGDAVANLEFIVNVNQADNVTSLEYALMGAANSATPPGFLSKHIADSLRTIAQELRGTMGNIKRMVENASYDSKQVIHELRPHIQFLTNLLASSRHESVPEPTLMDHDSHHDLLEELSSSSEERRKLQKQLLELEMAYQHSMLALEEAKKRSSSEFKKEMEKNTNDFVEIALNALDRSQIIFHLTGVLWSMLAVGSLIFSLWATYELAQFAILELKQNKDMQWALITFFAAKGSLLLALVLWATKISASLGRSYMHESLKSAERKHAIHYGKFYLSAFGTGAGNENVKEAFAQWNISSASAFSQDTKKQINANEESPLIESVMDKLIKQAFNSKGKE